MKIVTIGGQRVIVKNLVEVTNMYFRIVIGDHTPRQLDVAKKFKGALLNRQDRRALAFKYKGGRLLASIISLRKDMIKSGIKIGPMPRARSRKVLSGYKSQLLKIAFT